MARGFGSRVLLMLGEEEGVESGFSPLSQHPRHSAACLHTNNAAQPETGVQEARTTRVQVKKEYGSDGLPGASENER